MSIVPLFEEYRLIERSETEINGAWKGAHLLLFFLAFVFGSFCTFCFHMLMYLFDEKCVLFPKLLSLTTLRHNVIYEFIPSTKDFADLPVDFLSTQWVEKSTCSLPTYVPLVSGIFGLVWTTMFLMCSTGSRTLTGLQRPWRVLPPVFVFSLAMGALCVYSSIVTHSGLQELCIKLGEITGSATCTYTVNVATLTYERRIRGVYQATRLTILSAWLHTACWLLSALLALVRVLLAVDFQLVRVHVRLHGDIDKILEKHEVQIRTVSPEIWVNETMEILSDMELGRIKERADEGDVLTELRNENESDLLYLASHGFEASELSLVPAERNKLARIRAYKSVSKENIFIIKWLYDMLDTLHFNDAFSEQAILTTSSSTMSLKRDSQSIEITRQFGQEKIISQQDDISIPSQQKPIEKVDSLIIHERRITSKISDLEESKASTSREPTYEESMLNLTPELERVLETVSLKAMEKEEKERAKKSNLKTVGVQTKREKKRGLRVKISEKSVARIRSDTDDETSTDKKGDVDKETQTREKEKQD